jgi:hypothetical protein
VTVRASARLAGLVGLAAAVVAAAGGARPVPRAYAPEAGSEDTLRARLVGARANEGAGAHFLGAMVLGYLSAHGLPPVEGSLALSDTGLVFRSADGRDQRVLPVVGPLRRSPQGAWRASAVSLAYVDETSRHPAYLFRLDGGVFETDAPGPLLDLAAHPAWLDSLASREWSAERTLVGARDTAAATLLVSSLMAGAYADSLYTIFGRPAYPAGLVGAHGRAAGRLGEYVSSRDSLALDPARMTSAAQLRHTLAHELAHRWQARAGAQLAMLWQGIPPIRDPKRYGYGNAAEHQAEAAAFAVHFLLSTTSTASAADAAVEAATLDHYELLVPGTRTMARYFAMQPLFARHPLRSWLTTGRVAS